MFSLVFSHTKACGLALVVAGSLLVPAVALAAQPADLPPLLVRETEGELTDLGCTLHPADAPRQVTGTQWRAVIGSDATGEHLAWCPPAAVGQAHIAPAGEVAGITDVLRPGEARAQVGLGNPAGFGPSALENRVYDTQRSPVGTNTTIQSVEVSDASSTFSSIFNTLTSPATWFIDFALVKLFEFISFLALAVLRGIIGSLLVPVLSLDQFVTSPVVTSLWPLALGVANMGFLIALLVIALFTALRVESGGARRMLPRLFIGALLVNFSLLIGGVILDFTRLVMAVVVRALAPATGSATDAFLSASIFQAAGAGELTAHVAILTKDVLLAANFGGTIGAALLALVLWVLALAAIVLVFGLLIRYIALLVLLAVSPFAYLFLAFPNTGRLANQWWAMFLRYAFYGPVALIILLGGMRVVSALDDPTATVLAQAWLGVLQPVLLAAVFFAAAKSGSLAGVAGSAAAMSVFNRSTRRVGRGITRTAATGAYVGTGARFAVRQGRDALTGARGALRQRVKDLSGVAPAKRDDKGRLQKGERSAGLALGERLLGGAASRKEKDHIQTVRNVLGKEPRGADGRLADPKAALAQLNAAKIGSGELNLKAVKNSLRNEDVLSLAGATTKPAELRALAGDSEFLKSKGGDFRIELAGAVAKNKNIAGGPEVPTLEQLRERNPDATGAELAKVRSDLLTQQVRESHKIKEDILEGINKATRDKENA